MKDKFPNNKEGYRIGFHRPPVNSQYHLHLHMIVLPLKLEKHEITYGEKLTQPKDVMNQLETLLKYQKEFINNENLDNIQEYIEKIIED